MKSDHKVKSQTIVGRWKIMGNFSF